MIYVWESLKSQLIRIILIFKLLIERKLGFKDMFKSFLYPIQYVVY